MAKKASKKTSKKTSKKAARKTTRKTASKKSTKKTTRKSAAKTTTRKAAKKSVKKTAKKAADKTTPKTAKKKTQKKTADETSAKQKRKEKRKKQRKAAAKKAGMNKTQLKHFRKLLMEKRAALIGDMNGITAGSGRVGGSSELSSMPTHLADLGSDNYEHEFSLGLLESERTLLNEIEQALERIEDGTYGICLGTGEPIGKPRLEARPWAKYCIDYARKIEKGLVRPSRDEDDELDFDEEDEDED